MNKKTFTFVATLLITVLMFSMSSFAQQQPQAKSSIDQARTLYANGKFEQAQNSLLSLLKKKNLPKEQKFQALILLAEIRRAMLDEEGARKLIDKILDIQPDFNPSETDYPPNFIALVQSEKQKRMVKPEGIKKKHGSFFSNKYFWISIGGTAAATTAIILGTQKEGGHKKKVLPLPPNWPEGNH